MGPEHMDNTYNKALITDNSGLPSPQPLAESPSLPTRHLCTGPALLPPALTRDKQPPPNRNASQK